MTNSTDKFSFDWKIIMMAVLMKAAVIAVILYFYDFGNLANVWNLQKFQISRSLFNDVYRPLLPLSFWDGQFYLFIAKYGYLYEKHCAFYPLYPGLMSCANMVFRNLYVTGLVLGFATSLPFALFLFNYTKGYLGDRGKSYSLVLLVLCWPASLFMSVFYADGLYLVLFFGFVYYLNRGSRMSLLFIVPLVFCKGNSLFVLASVCLFLVLGYFSKKKINRLHAEAVLVFISGYLLLFGYYYGISGNMFAMMSAQDTFVFGNSLWNIINPVHFLSYLLKPSYEFYSYSNSILDKMAVVAFLGAGYFVVKSKNISLISFYIPLVLLPALMGEGGSYFRHTLAALPFLALSLWTLYKIRTRYVLIFSCLMFFCQIALAVRWAHNLWIN